MSCHCNLASRYRLGFWTLFVLFVVCQGVDVAATYAFATIHPEVFVEHNPFAARLMTLGLFWQVVVPYKSAMTLALSALCGAAIAKNRSRVAWGGLTLCALFHAGLALAHYLFWTAFNTTLPW